MKKDLQNQIQELGELLGSSMLDQEIKKAILRDAHLLTEEQVGVLLAALRNENTALEDLTKTIKEFQKDSDKRWREAEAAQKVTAEQWLTDAVETLLTE